MLFAKKGPENTAQTLSLALAAATERKLPIVAASHTGATGLLLCEMARTQGFGGDIVVVAHALGTNGPGVQDMLPENRDILLRNDVRIVTASHALSGAERALSTKFGGVYPVEIIAHTLRMFSQGVKVAVEIGCMALDAGEIPYGQGIIAIGGTGRGADTAVRLVPNHAKAIFETKIQEILCMPE